VTNTPTGTAFFLCGLPGSGKTTKARELERTQNAIVFSEDIWIRDLYDQSAIHDDEKRELVKVVQWNLARSLLLRGINIVLDWGVWARIERDHYRAETTAIGASYKLIYLDVPLEELQRRIAQRNQNRPPDSFHIEPHELAQWATWFEPPTAAEF